MREHKKRLDANIMMLRDTIVVQLKYLNRRKNMIPSLEIAYNQLTEELESIKSTFPEPDTNRKGFNPQGYTNRMVYIISRKIEIERQLRDLNSQIEILEKAFYTLPVDKQRILTLCFIDKPRGKRMREAVDAAAEELNYDRSSIYRKMNEALDDLVAILYGVNP